MKRWSSSDPDSQSGTIVGAGDITPSDEGLGDPIEEFLAPGAIVSDYVIEEATNQGGFASVYRARHRKTNRRVALKVLWKELTSSKRLVQRFEHEAKTLMALHHPNIVEILELGDLDDGRPYFAMEWLGARNLRDVIRSRGPLAAGEALAVMEEIGAGLTAAHQVGVVHRDLKAQNIMVVPKGDWFTVKLVDFGIAKVLEPEKVGLQEFVTTSTILGTPFYMAPEQILGQAVDQRTDIYALGLLLYELVTGELPFRGETRVEVEEMHLHATPPRASAVAQVSAGFDGVIGRCLEKDPAKRYATVGDAVADLRRVVSEVGALAEAPDTVGVGMHVEARIDPTLTDVPEAAFDDVDAVMDLARGACADAELQLDLESASALLGLALLPADRKLATAIRGRLVVIARDLDARLAMRATKSSHVQVAITLHAASVKVRTGEGAGAGARPEFVEGELVHLGDWTAGHPGSGVAVTRAIVEELDGLKLTPIDGRPDLFRLG
jgi:serine/threonine-protein kinase